MRTRVMLTVVLVFLASTTYAESLMCSLADYTALPGLTARVADDTLTVAWEGDNGAQLRMRLAIDRAGRRRSGSSLFGPEVASGARWRPT